MIDEILAGDCLALLRTLDDNSVDALCCDPPAGISFMSKSWDSDKGGKQEWIAWLTEVMAECLRVVKPGGHALVWALPRTSHWTATALEDAGWQIRDVISSVFGSGFPKSLDIAKSAANQGLICQCRKHEVQYLMQEVSGNVSKEDLYQLRSRVATDDALSIGAQSHMQQAMLSTTNAQETGKGAYADVPAMRPTIQTQEPYHAEQGEVLQHSLRSAAQDTERGIQGASQEDCSNGPRWMDRGDEGGISAEDARRAQSSMEGRHNQEENTRQLSGSDVHSLPSSLPINGAQGWLCDDTSADSGADGKATTSKRRSRTPHRPQSSEQQRGQSGVMARQQDAQASRAWDICTRCNLPIIPQGIGSALKPAHENWILARKPLACANLASNVLAWGTGGINVDGCRVGDDGGTKKGNPPKGASKNTYGNGINGKCEIVPLQSGRWPPNFLLSHSPECTPLACAEDCAVRLLDEQAGERKLGGDVTGKYGGMFGNGKQIVNPVERLEHSVTVSRFFPVFYAAKASRAERNQGCEALPALTALRFGEKGQGPLPQQTPHVAKPEQNNHPTVKSLALMRWLVRLVTPPNGIVLDCFAGSGSTLVACKMEGFHFIGMEQDASYIKIARARVAHAKPETAKPKRAKITRLPKRSAHAEQLALFA